MSQRQKALITISKNYRQLSWEVQTIATKVNNRRLIVILISAVAAFFILIIGVLGFFYYQSSPQYAIQEVNSAVKTNDYKKFSRIVPEYSDGKKIDKTAFNAFASAVKSNKINLTKLLNNESSFKKVSHLFVITRFLPKARYIKLTSDNSATTMGISADKQFITMAKSGEKAGPFIPASYQMSYSINSAIYGELDEKEKVNLTDSSQEAEIDETDLFLSNPKFQKSLVNSYGNYMKSLISCINNGLDFSNLKGLSDDAKASFIEYFQELKPQLKNYTETFSTAVLNGDSVKALGANRENLQFDIYTDDTISATNTDGKQASNDDHNATVTLSYDEDQGAWQITDIEFDTFTGDASSWKHQQVYKLGTPIKGTWTSGQADKENSV